MSSPRVPLAAFLLSTVACTSVQQVREPAQFIPQTKPDVVVVFYHDNAQVPVAEPRISGDSLIGTWAGLGEPVAVPLSQVARIDAVQRSKKRTTFLIAGLTAVTAAGIYALVQASTGGRRVCDYSTGGPGDNCVGSGWDGPGPN